MTIDARGLVIAELKAATDEMSFDLCGNDFAYVANRLMPIFAREREAQSATIERMREALVDARKVLCAIPAPPSPMLYEQLHIAIDEIDAALATKGASK